MLFIYERKWFLVVLPWHYRSMSAFGFPISLVPFSTMYQARPLVCSTAALKCLQHLFFQRATIFRCQFVVLELIVGVILLVPLFDIRHRYFAITNGCCRSLPTVYGYAKNIRCGSFPHEDMIYPVERRTIWRSLYSLVDPS